MGLNFSNLDYTKGTVLYPLFRLLDIWVSVIGEILYIQRNQLHLTTNIYAGHAVADWAVSGGKSKEDILAMLPNLRSFVHGVDAS